MIERPLSPWRGPDGPLFRLRASRYGLAIIAVVTIVLLGIVGVAISVLEDADPGSGDAPIEQTPPAEPDG
jgi:hypothetical protein